MKTEQRFTISGGLLDRKHRRQMGTANWTFLWLIKHQNGHDGEVLHGELITAARIAADLDYSTHTILQHLKKLVKLGYIDRQLPKMGPFGTATSGDAYSYTIRNPKKFYATVPENANGSQNTSYPLQKTGTPLTENGNSNKEEKKEEGINIGNEPDGSQLSILPTMPAIDLLNDALTEVWQHYLITIGRNPKTYECTPLRKKKGNTRLKECLKRTGGDIAKAVDLMKLTVDGLAASDWHMGRDPKTNGKRYCDWETHLFGSYERMEKWWNQ